MSKAQKPSLGDIFFPQLSEEQWRHMRSVDAAVACVKQRNRFALYYKTHPTGLSVRAAQHRKKKLNERVNELFCLVADLGGVVVALRDRNAEDEVYLKAKLILSDLSQLSELLACSAEVAR